MNLKHTLFVALVSLSALLTGPRSLAATYTWTGAGFFGNQDYLWSNPNNWAELAAPQNGEQGVQLVFPATGAPRATTNDVLNLVVKSVIFQGANYAIHGAGANGTTLNLRGDSGGEFAVASLATGCQFGGSTRLQLASAGTFTIASATTLTIKSKIGGIYGFTKTGPGTLSLQGLQANTFTGPLTVLNGVADFRCVGTAVPGALVVGGGNTLYAPIARLYLNDQISDTSPVTVNANATLELDGHNDTIGALTLASGTVTTIEGINSGILTLNGNVTNRVGTAGIQGTILGKLSLGSTTRGFNVEDSTELRIEADVSGVTAGVTKSGAGQLTLAGANNTYAGFTTVQAGTLELTGLAQPGSTANGTVLGQGAQLLLRDVSIANEALSLNGTTNRPALAFVGTNAWAGAITLTGDCQLQPVPQTGSDKLTLSGAISGPGSLRLIGWGDVYLTGLGGNTFSGGYYAESGLTHFAKAASAPALGGPLFVGRADESFPAAHAIVETLNQIPNASVITLFNSGVLTGDADDTLGPVIFEGGWLMAMNGTFTLGGHVTIRPSPQNTAAIYGPIVLPAGEHIFAFTDFGILDVHGVLQGPGGVTMQGDAGALQFYGANTYAGLTRIESGRLYLREDGQPGSGAAGTVLEGRARLNFYNAHVANETLVVNPAGGYTPWIGSVGSNAWNGSITLNANLDIEGFAGSELVLGGAISGTGGVTYHGEEFLPIDGTLVFSGANDNTYAGGTTILEGTLLLNKIGRAIPNSLTVGSDASGADAAGVYCLRPGQFTPATDAAQMDLWRLTVNSAGALHCSGFDQTVPGITTRGGAVFTEGGTLGLQQGWKVEPDSGTSRLLGQLRLNSLASGFTHILDVETNSDLLVWGDIGQAALLAHVEKQGRGTLSMISSNSFAGNFTLRDGLTVVSGAQPYGTLSGHTRVDADATLITFSGANAEPFILTGSGFQNQGALVVHGTNEFNGPITLGSATDVVTPDATDLATFAGSISGPGGLTKRGNGKVTFAGNVDNTYAGVTLAKEGTIELAKDNATAVTGALDIRTNALVRYARDHQLSDLVPVTMAAGSQFRLLGHSDTIGSLAGYGLVEMLNGALITGHNNVETTFAGQISGLGGNLTKTGTNTFTLAGNNAYTGTTFVKGGTLLVRGQQPQSDVTIQTGGTLGGNGTVGVISDLSGHVKPGANAYGILKCAGFLTHAPANQFRVAINGTTPGVDCDQLDVSGGLTLMGGTLNLAMNFAGAVSNQYVIIKNDGVDGVTGTFNGLPQDAILTANGVAFQIDYHGGDGNDVVLVQRSVAGVGPTLDDISKLSDGSIQIAGTGIPGATYDLEASSDLSEPDGWQKIAEVSAEAPGGALKFTDPDAPNFAQRFYRFVLQ